MRKTIIILIVLFLGLSKFTFSQQELYYIWPIDSKKTFKKDKLYFPKHKVNIENSYEVYNKGDLIFRVPSGKIYRNHFEIFEDIDKKQYVIITTILKEKDHFPGVNAIPREQIYIIPLFDNNNIYYANLEGTIIGTKRGYDNLKDFKDKYGNLLESIDLKKMKIKLMIDKLGEKPSSRYFDIYQLETFN